VSIKQRVDAVVDGLYVYQSTASGTHTYRTLPADLDRGQVVVHRDEAWEATYTAHDGRVSRRAEGVGVGTLELFVKDVQDALALAVKEA
jgi:hypothetical protein